MKMTTKKERKEIFPLVIALMPKTQGHQELSGESDENNPLKSNQIGPSIDIMIELCFISLDQ